jgi:DNA-binding response OmpR family regulator
MSEKATHILVVDSDTVLSRNVLRYLTQQAGWVCSHSYTLEGAEQHLSSGSPVDVVMSDIVLTGGSGYDVFKAARNSGVNSYNILALGVSEYPSEGVRLDTSDIAFLTKPYRLKELVSLIAEGTGAVVDPKRYSLRITEEGGAWHLHSDHEGLSVQLTGQEKRMMDEFLFSPCLPLSREDLYRSVHNCEQPLEDRAVDNLKSRLTPKLKKITNGRVKIEAVRGRGYKLVCN